MIALLKREFRILVTIRSMMIVLVNLRWRILVMIRSMMTVLSICDGGYCWY
uniref:Uncharacterized protein n=1 Tax=Helianthus annuus TaxID=4232 RepID=A0A251UXZ8_HELAN